MEIKTLMFKYQLYKSHTVSIAKQLRRAMGISKKRNDELVIGDAMRMNPDMLNTITNLTFIEEYVYRRNGSKTIFVESKELLDALISMDVSIQDMSNFKLPFDSFQLALPQEYTYNGVAMNSLIVNRYVYQTSADEIIRPYMKALGLSDMDMEIRNDKCEENEKCIVICQNSDNGETVQRLLQVDSVVMDFAKQQDVKEMRENPAVSDTVSIDQTDEDLLAQNYALRLVLALSAFHSATAGEYLREGLPRANPRQMVTHGAWDKTIRSFTLKTNEHLCGSSDGTLVRPHLRQCMSERYYQNEYAKIPVGQRFIFVNQYTRGKIEAHTLSDQG